MQKTFTINLKRLGKKKIFKQEYELDQPINNLEDLIRACVTKEVENFNQKRENNSLLKFLSPTEIQEKAQDGKVDFGDLMNTEKAELEKSMETAFLAHKDGLFAVFVDDEEVSELKQSIMVDENTNITFIRLTFLTGMYW
jgi:hypothetical protein